MDTNAARRVLAAEEETRQKREFNGKNWPFHFKMAEFQRKYWEGVQFFPNLREITSEEFAAHNCISGSYGSKLLGTANTKFIEGMKYQRYAKVMFQTVQDDAGRGVAFVAVPANDADWDKSQHQRVPLKLRHWTFCLCDHKFERSAYRNCVTTYTCSECDWTFEVDSSG